MQLMEFVKISFGIHQKLNAKKNDSVYCYEMSFVCLFLYYL